MISFVFLEYLERKMKIVAFYNFLIIKKIYLLIGERKMAAFFI